jgi:hypothetical protein
MIASWAGQNHSGKPLHLQCSEQSTKTRERHAGPSNRSANIVNRRIFSDYGLWQVNRSARGQP